MSAYVWVAFFAVMLCAGFLYVSLNHVYETKYTTLAQDYNLSGDTTWNLLVKMWTYSPLAVLFILIIWAFTYAQKRRIEEEFG